MKMYVSFDIGGTMIKHSLIDENGRIVENHYTPTEAKRGGQYILKKVQEITEEYIRQSVLSGICVSTAGTVNSDDGSIVYANENISNYTGTKLKQILENRFGILCEVENDVICAGLAEQLSGASKGSKVSFCLTVGTGIGGCIIVNGKVFHGAAYSAGNIGNLNMFGTQFEKLASTGALVKKVAASMEYDPRELDGIKVFEMAKAGNRICIDAIDKMCEMLGYGIANVCYVINPEVVVIGGGIAKQEDYLYERIRKSMDMHLIPEISVNTKLAFAKHGNDAGMLGAYYNFCEKYRVNEI